MPATANEPVKQENSISDNEQRQHIDNHGLCGIAAWGIVDTKQSNNSKTNKEECDDKK